MDIATLTASDLLRHYRARKLSPVEVTKAVQTRIDALDPAHNAFCVRADAEALAAARASEARWMAGTPMGLVDGVPATRRLRTTHRPSRACASTARCSSARRRCRNSAGRAPGTRP